MKTTYHADEPAARGPAAAHGTLEASGGTSPDGFVEPHIVAGRACLGRRSPVRAGRAGHRGGENMAAEKVPSRAHGFFLQIERLSEARLRLLVAALAGVAVVFLVLMMLVLEHVPNPWLRAPLVLITGGLMSAGGMGAGVFLYELRHRR